MRAAALEAELEAARTQIAEMHAKLRPLEEVESDASAHVAEATSAMAAMEVRMRLKEEQVASVEAQMAALKQETDIWKIEQEAQWYERMERNTAPGVTPPRSTPPSSASFSASAFSSDSDSGSVVQL